MIGIVTQQYRIVAAKLWIGARVESGIKAENGPLVDDPGSAGKRRSDGFEIRHLGFWKGGFWKGGGKNGEALVVTHRVLGQIARYRLEL